MRRLGCHEGRQQGSGHPCAFEFVEGLGELAGLHGFVTLERPLQAGPEEAPDHRSRVEPQPGGVGDPEAQGARALGPTEGAHPELGDDHRLARGQEGLEHLDVAVLGARLAVVVDAHVVEGPPVHLLEGERGVGERATEHGAQSGHQGSQVRVELPVAEQRRVCLEALQAPGDALAGEDPRHEERELAAGDEDHAPWMGRLQPCRRLGRGDQSGRRLLGRVLEEGRREPHLEAEPERDLGDGRQPSDVTAHDPHGVGVQVVPDDLELAAHDRQVEGRPARRDGIARAAEHRPRVVVDSLGAARRLDPRPPTSIVYPRWDGWGDFAPDQFFGKSEQTESAEVEAPPISVPGLGRRSASSAVLRRKDPCQRCWRCSSR